jgi:hypothetical protein
LVFQPALIPGLTGRGWVRTLEHSRAHFQPA